MSNTLIVKRVLYLGRVFVESKVIIKPDVKVTKNDFDYFIESSGVDWSIDLIDSKTVFIRIESKTKVIDQTKSVTVVSRPITSNKKTANE